MRVRGKGGPLKRLGLLLIAWVTVRAATFSAVPTVNPPMPETPSLVMPPTPADALAVSDAFASDPEFARSSAGFSRSQRPAFASVGRAIVPDSLSRAQRSRLILAPSPPTLSMNKASKASGLAVGGLQRNEVAPYQPLAAALPTRTQPSRWSGDGWMLLRRGNGGEAASGLRPASYGAGQAGGILRYRLAPGSDRRPFAYLRATTTLRGPSEQQAALGLGLRPLAHIPVSAAAEVRAVEGAGGLKTQPAAFLFTELAPIVLPAQLQAELYAQAGYVGGAFATAFADGQLRIDRPLAEVGRAPARLGGGAWGGAQKGAARLDVGPSATIWLPLSPSSGARLALDWRLRVAGDAEPRSGPALTLSSGF
jgi:hypothetical protein